MANWAFVFPGQGSQAIGMGKELAESHAEARAVFQEVDDTLSFALTRLMFEGDPEQLTLTENAQPALMAVSLAVVRVLERQLGGPLADRAQAMAGHSLGEYSALAAAGAVSLADAARLLRLRGQAMQHATPVGTGAMAAVLGLDMDVLEPICAEVSAGGQICVCANDNAPGQIVISGHTAAVAEVSERAKAAGAKRTLPLPVSAPFHSPLMKPAAERMAEALAETTINDIPVPVVANVTAAPMTSADEIRERLVEQVTGRVRWRESVQRLAADGIEKAAELGSGAVLAGLIKRIDRSIDGTSVGTPAAIDQLLEQLLA